MKKSLLASALALLLIGAAQAQDNAPDDALTANAAVTSDYRYRGISQTRLQPAIQGGIDYLDSPGGWYAGAWLSTIRWTRDAGGGGGVELDFYAGKRGTLVDDIGYDIGVLTYVYPANGLAGVPGYASANTTEAYAQMSKGPILVKYSHAMTNLFGFVDSRHSGYLDLGANLDAGSGYTVNLHVGHQTVQHAAAASYTDWKLGVTKDFGVVTGALAFVGTDASATAYASPANGKFLGKTALLLTVSKTFGVARAD